MPTYHVQVGDTLMPTMFVFKFTRLGLCLLKSYFALKIFFSFFFLFPFWNLIDSDVGELLSLLLNRLARRGSLVASPECCFPVVWNNCNVIASSVILHAHCLMS